MHKHLVSLLIFMLFGTVLRGVLPMREQWKFATDSFAAGQAAQAALAFQEFAEWYGNEQAVTDPAFRESLYRLWAMAAIANGQYELGLQLIGNWMQFNEPQDPFHSFLLFQEVRLHHVLRQTEPAQSKGEAFLELYPELPERCLVRGYLAQNALLEKDHSRARIHWTSIIEDEQLPALARDLVSGALALLELKANQPLEAFKWLARPASSECLPPWRAFLAPALSAELLQGDRLKEALQASAWLNPNAIEPPYLQPPPPPASTHPMRDAIWKAHWSAEQDQLRVLFENASPNSAHLFALRLRALRKAQQLEEVCILARALLRSNRDVPGDINALAYREGIEALLRLEKWDEAARWVEDFTQSYPLDPDVPNIQLMAARALAGQKKWPQALTHIQQLLTDWPDHASAPSWEFLRAQWLLSSGQAHTALAHFRSLKTRCPDAWQGLIDLQIGLCLIASEDIPEALPIFSEVASNANNPLDIRETAHLEILKLHLGNAQAFHQRYKCYQDEIPQGQLATAIDNLAATHHLLIDDWDQAYALWEPIAATTLPEAQFARQQLLQELTRRQLWDTLGQAAIGWLSVDWRDAQTATSEALQAATRAQTMTHRAALPISLAIDLFEAIKAGANVPPLDVFRLLEGAWPHYAASLDAGSVSFAEWLETQAAPDNPNTRMRATARLHIAESFDNQGRPDSADAKRIAVLNEKADLQWDAEPAFILAKTAQTYDFPDAVGRLSAFIMQFRVDQRYPDSLLLLAAQFMEIDHLEKAAPLLKELSSDWPDALVHSQGCMKLAELHIRLGEPEQALPLLDRVLQEQNEADFVAKALHHRLQADLLLKNLDRAIVTAMRLLTLYPEQHPLYRESLSHLLAATARENLSAQSAKLKDAFLSLINEKLPNPSEA